MGKPIAIIAGEPNSISSEIIFKSWKLRSNYLRCPLIIVGSISLLEQQKNKLKYKGINIKEINGNFRISDLKKNQLHVYNINYKQKKPFDKITTSSRKYVLKCFETTLRLVKNKKIKGFINCPVSKEILFPKKQQGITEYLARKASVEGNEVMLIFNKKLSVSPLTTHIPLSLVTKKINKAKIISKIKTINNFYVKRFKKKPKIAILGLNPHNYTSLKKSEEKNIIEPAIKSIKKLNINVSGPISPDTSFIFAKKYKFDIIFGMYHDQVLTPYKTIFNYDAINITLGLPYIRISPDHGTANDIVGKNIANPQSLIASIKFFNYLK